MPFEAVPDHVPTNSSTVNAGCDDDDEHAATQAVMTAR
jgi:hypothetical protein